MFLKYTNNIKDISNFDNKPINQEESDKLLNTDMDDNDEEDDILNQKILDAIIELTKVINSNNEIVSEQNSILTLKLDSLEEKVNTIIKQNESVEDDEMSIVDKTHNSNDNIVVLTENDLEKKIIAVVVDDTTVCFDILELARKGIASLEQKTEYLSVTDITVSNM